MQQIVLDSLLDPQINFILFLFFYVKHLYTTTPPKYKYIRRRRNVKLTAGRQKLIHDHDTIKEGNRGRLNTGRIKQKQMNGVNKA